VVRRLLGSLLGADVTEQDAAWRRAEGLLRDSLTSEQYDSYRTRGWIEVRSRSVPHRAYRVDGWRPVAVYEHGQFVGAVCIRPREHIPGPDILLARKLMIEGAEGEFLRAGNWLQPAWRPAGAAPTLFLLFALLSPWLLHLKQLGPWGLLAGALLLGLPAAFAYRRRRRAVSPVASSDDRPGTPRVDAEARTERPDPAPAPAGSERRRSRAG
jgi:LPXTG-motif cell wall-anchored protein